jgi:hypothetical protein
MTINDSGKFISPTEQHLGAAPFISRSGFVTASAEPAAHLSAIAGEPRSDDSGRRPARPASRNSWVGRAGTFRPRHQSPHGEANRKLAPLSSGEAMTVGDPPAWMPLSGRPPARQPSSWGPVSGGSSQEQWQ